LNYSTDSLLRVFPKYFKDRATADKYARKPEMIASRVYGGRMGNGDEASKEGFAFRGRGFLQVTGKENYKAFSAFIGEDCVANPDLVATKYPMDSAIWFFDKNKLWQIAEKGSTDAVVTEVTKRVNGGTHGLADRLSKFKTYHALLIS
jgi:putative chitinase